VNTGNAPPAFGLFTTMTAQLSMTTMDFMPSDESEAHPLVCAYGECRSANGDAPRGVVSTDVEGIFPPVGCAVGTAPQHPLLEEIEHGGQAPTCSLSDVNFIPDFDVKLIVKLANCDYTGYAKSLEARISLSKLRGWDPSAYETALTRFKRDDYFSFQGGALSMNYNHTHSVDQNTVGVLNDFLAHVDVLTTKTLIATSKEHTGVGDVVKGFSTACNRTTIFLGLAFMFLTIMWYTRRNGEYQDLSALALLLGALGGLLASRIDYAALYTSLMGLFAAPCVAMVPFGADFSLQSGALDVCSEVVSMVSEVASLIFFGTRVKVDHGIDTLLKTLSTAEADSRTVGNIFSKVGDVVMRIVEGVARACGADIAFTLQSEFALSYKRLETDVQALIKDIEDSSYVNSGHLVRLQGFASTITKMQMTMPDKTQNNMVKSKLSATMTAIQALIREITAKLARGGNARFEPMAINIVGTPGCGKTTVIMKNLWRLNILSFKQDASPGVERTKEDIDAASKKPVNFIGSSTKYFDGFDPVLPVTFHNEFLQGKSAADANAIERIVIDWIGSNPAEMPVAVAEMKGKLFFDARFYITSSNHLTCPNTLAGLETLGVDALTRRFDKWCYRMFVVPEYALRNASGQLITMGTITPGFTCNVFGYMVDPVKAQAASDRLGNGETSMEPYRLVRWCWRTGVPKGEALKVEAFFRELETEYAVHATRQGNLMGTTDKARENYVAGLGSEVPVDVPDRMTLANLRAAVYDETSSDSDGPKDKKRPQRGFVASNNKRRFKSTVDTGKITLQGNVTMYGAGRYATEQRESELESAEKDNTDLLEHIPAEYLAGIRKFTSLTEHLDYECIVPPHRHVTVALETEDSCHPLPCTCDKEHVAQFKVFDEKTVFQWYLNEWLEDYAFATRHSSEGYESDDSELGGLDIPDNFDIGGPVEFQVNSSSLRATPSDLEMYLSCPEHERESVAHAISEVAALERARDDEDSVSSRTFAREKQRSTLCSGDAQTHLQWFASVCGDTWVKTGEGIVYAWQCTRDALLLSLLTIQDYFSELRTSWEQAKWQDWFLDHPILTFFSVTAAGVLTGGLLYSAVMGIIAMTAPAVSSGNVPAQNVPEVATVVPVVEPVMPSDPASIVLQTNPTVGQLNIRQIVARNTYLMKFVVKDDVGTEIGCYTPGHVLFACGRSFVTNAHLWNSLADKYKRDKIVVQLYDMFTKHLTFSASHQWFTTRDDYLKRDIVIVTCPREFREHSDITKFMLDSSDAGLAETLASGSHPGTMLRSDGKFHDTILTYGGVRNMSGVQIPHTMSLPAKTVVGDCGLPVLLSSPELTKGGKTESVIYGIHFAKAVHADVALSNFITRNMFKSLAISSNLGATDALFSFNCGIERLSTITGACAPRFLAVPTNVQMPNLVLPARVVGTLEPPLAVVSHSLYGRGKLYKVCNELLKAEGVDVIEDKLPAKLKSPPGETEMTILSAAGYGMNATPLADRVLLRTIVLGLGNKLSKILSVQGDRDVPILNYEDLVNERPDMPGIDLSKAAGLQFRSVGITRNDLWPEHNLGGRSSLEYFATLNAYDDQVSKGHETLALFGFQCLKDELRGRGKIARTILPQDNNYLMVVKKYLGQFVVAITGFDFKVAVGTNTYQDGPAMYEEYDGPRTIVGDHKKWDKSLLAAVMCELGILVEIFYKDTPHDTPHCAAMRDKCMDSLLHWFMVVTTDDKSYICEMNGAMPSGDFRTAVFNSLYNYVATLYVMARNLKGRGVRVDKALVASIIDQVGGSFYGDDFILNLQRCPVLWHFTFFDLRDGFHREFGTDVTTSSKKDGAGTAYQVLKEETWLGRHFVYARGQWNLALKYKSIFGCLYFVKKGVTPAQYTEMVENSLMELSFHGKEMFDKFVPEIARAMHILQGEVLTNSDFEVAWTNCKSRSNEF